MGLQMSKYIECGRTVHEVVALQILKQLLSALEHCLREDLTFRLRQGSGTVIDDYSLKLLYRYASAVVLAPRIF
jgi:hypothetical protein